MAHRLTRAKLYNLVWSAPLSTPAPRFGVSGVALAKACRAVGIPVSERGHWARRQAGVPPPLPQRSPGAPDSVVIGRLRSPGWSRSDALSAPSRQRRCLRKTVRR